MNAAFRPALLAIAVQLAMSATAAAPVYRWTDASGQVHFGQTPPANAAYEVIRGRGETPAATAAPGDPAAAAPTQRDRDQQFLKQAEAEREARAKDKQAERLARLEAQKKCAAASERVAFFETRGAGRLRVETEDGGHARMAPEEFAKRLDAARAEVATHCR